MVPPNFPLWQIRSIGHTRWRDCSRMTSINLDRLSQRYDNPVGGSCTIYHGSGVGRNYECVSDDGSILRMMRQGVGFEVQRVCIIMVHSKWCSESNKVQCFGLLNGDLMMEFEATDVAHQNWGEFSWRVADRLGRPSTHVLNLPSSVIGSAESIEEWRASPQCRKHVRTLLEITSVGPEHSIAKRMWRTHNQWSTQDHICFMVVFRL